MKTCVHLRQHVTEFSKWEMFQTSAAEKIKTHILCSKTFSKYHAFFLDNVENVVEPNMTQVIV